MITFMLLLLMTYVLSLTIFGNRYATTPPGPGKDRFAMKLRLGAIAFPMLSLSMIWGYALATPAMPSPSPSSPSPSPVQAHVVYASVERDADDEDEREASEDLPVPIVPGTRVTEARIAPPEREPEPDEAMIRRPWAGRNKIRIQPPRVVTLPAPSTIRLISGRLFATPERARDDARLRLEREVRGWLAPEVPTYWKPPARLINQMIRKTDTHPIVNSSLPPEVKDYGIYETTLDVDFSSTNRDEFLVAYQRGVVSQRLAILGGSLGFVLACLAAVAGYIRADEATKGYYTHWLRAIAAAGVGAAGVVLYQVLA